MIKSKTNKDYFKYLSLVLATFLVLLTLVGCGSSKNSTSDMVGSTESVPTSEPSYQKNKDSVFLKESESLAPPSTNSNVQTGHKIIQTGQINLETVKFDETITSVQNYVNSIGGYVQSSSIQGKGIDINNAPSKRHGTFTVRVPQNEHSKFFTSIKIYGTITYQESKGDDITEQYFDTEARVKSLLIQEERILDILKKTDKLSDIIELEKHLTEIRYQLDSLTGSLKKWDNLVTFSTITLQIQEVKEVTKIAPENSNGLLKRMAYAFTNSIKQLGIFFQASLIFISIILPFLVAFTLIVLVILYICKKYNKLNHGRNIMSTTTSTDDLKNDYNAKNDTTQKDNT